MIIKKSVPKSNVEFQCPICGILIKNKLLYLYHRSLCQENFFKGVL